MPLDALPPFLIIYITYQARHLSAMEVGLKAFMLINHTIVIMHIFVLFFFLLPNSSIYTLKNTFQNLSR